MTADRTNMRFPFDLPRPGSLNIGAIRPYIQVVPVTPAANIVFSIAPGGLPLYYSIPLNGGFVTNPGAVTRITSGPSTFYSQDTNPALIQIFDTVDWTMNLNALIIIGPGASQIQGAIYYKVWKVNTTGTFTLLSPTNAPTSDWIAIGAFLTTNLTSPMSVTGTNTFTPTSTALNREFIVIEFLLEVRVLTLAALSTANIKLNLGNSSLNPTTATWLETGHYKRPFKH